VKNSKVTHSRKTASSNEKQTFRFTTTVGQGTKVRTPRRLIKLSRWVTKTRHSK